MTHTKYIVAETGKEIPIEEVVRLKNNRDFFQLGPISNAISGWSKFPCPFLLVSSKHSSFTREKR